MEIIKYCYSLIVNRKKTPIIVLKNPTKQEFLNLRKDVDEKYKEYLRPGPHRGKPAAIGQNYRFVYNKDIYIWESFFFTHDDIANSYRLSNFWVAGRIRNREFMLYNEPTDDLLYKLNKLDIRPFLS